MYGGVPVLGDNDFATFVFENGSLTSATIRLQRFHADEVRRTVLPARQAAAGAQGKRADLMVAYRSDGDYFAPGRFICDAVRTAGREERTLCNGVR